MLNKYKIFAGHMIVESKNTKEVKVQLLNFIKSATEPQTKNFILNGTVVENIKEDSENAINEQFEKYYLEAGGKVAQARKTYFSAANSPLAYTAGGVQAALAGSGVGLAAAAGGAGIWALYRAIRSKYDVCTKRCGTFELNTARRQHCMAKCKIGKEFKELLAAKKAKNAKEIAKKTAALAKAKQTFANYEKSFKGKDKPGK